MSETLYIKKGRRYVPYMIEWNADRDRMRVNTFRLTYAYKEGARAYEYNVNADTASFVAAAMIAKQAMVDEMSKAALATPSQPQQDIPPEQMAVINQFREAMGKVGGLLPTWWVSASPYKIAEAGIKAVQDYKPEEEQL